MGFPFLGDKIYQRRSNTSNSNSNHNKEEEIHRHCRNFVRCGTYRLHCCSIRFLQWSSGDNGGGGRGGGHGIRASVDTVDGLLLLSSVDLRSGWSGDNTCIPATGTRVGKSFQEGDTPFETCYKNEHTEEECWSKSYFNGCFWTECLPKDKGWHFLNSGAASS